MSTDFFCLILLALSVMNAFSVWISIKRWKWANRLLEAAQMLCRRNEKIFNLMQQASQAKDIETIKKHMRKYLHEDLGCPFAKLNFP